MGLFFLGFLKMARQRGLSSKHWKALKLIQEGKLSLKEIAKKLGWSPSMLYALHRGDVRKAGSTAELFKSELLKVKERNYASNKHIIIRNKLRVLEMFNEYLRDVRAGKQKATPREMIRIANALNNFRLEDDIAGRSFNFSNVLSAEELVSEFRRLKSIAM